MRAERLADDAFDSLDKGRSEDDAPSYGDDTDMEVEARLKKFDMAMRERDYAGAAKHFRAAIGACKE